MADSPLYSAFLAAYGVDDDIAPSLDEELVKSWERLNKTVADYRAKRDALAVKAETEKIKARLGYIKSSRDYHAKLEETAGKDRRVSAQVMTQRANQLTKSMSDIVRDTNAYAGTLLNDFRAQKTQGNDAAALETMFQTLTNKSVQVKEPSPLNAALATQVFTSIVGKPSLQDVTEQDVRAKLEGKASPELIAKTIGFLETSKQADRAVTSAMKKIESEAQLLNNYGAGGDLTSPESIEDALQASARANLAFQVLVGESEEELAAGMEALAEADSEYQRQLSRERELYSYIFRPGGEGTFTRTGKVLADPEFRAWAADNGYVIGDAAIDAKGDLQYYTPGSKDMAAIIAYNRQARTGAPPRAFGTNRTGDLVRVTVTDPAARERVLRTSDLGGGRYAVKDGVVLSPSQYVEAGARPRGVKIATAGDKVYAKFEGKTYLYDDGAGMFNAADAPADLVFSDGVVYDDDGNPTRYMTNEDIAFAAPTSFGGISAGEDAAINKSMGIEIVGADKLPAVGEMSYLGYRDKVNARTLGQYGAGAISINGGQQVFTKGAKVEVLESRGVVPRGQRISDAITGRAIRRAAKIGEPETLLTREEVATVTPGLAVGAAAPAVPAPGFQVPGAGAGKDAEFVQFDDGSVFAIGEAGAQMVTAPRGSRLDTTVIKPTDAAYDALADKMEAAGAVLSDDEVQAIRTRRVGAEQEAPAGEGPVIRDERGNVIIDYGRRRTVGGDIREALGEAGRAVGGLFRRPPAAEAEAAPPVEAPPAKAKREAAPPTPAQQRREAARQAEAAALPVLPEVSEPAGGGVVKRDAVGAFYAGMAPLRDEALMRSLKDVKPGQPGYSVAQRYKAARQVFEGGGDAKAYYEEVAKLAKEARRPVRDVAFTPSVAEEPTAGYEARQAAKRAEIAAEGPVLPTPPTTEDMKRQAAFDAFREARRAKKQERQFREAAVREKYGEPEAAVEFKSAVEELDRQREAAPEAEQQAKAGEKPKKPGLSTFRKFMPKRNIPTETGVA